MSTLCVAHFTVHADARQSVRWKIGAESEGYASVGKWLAAAADSYLKARVRAGAPVPLGWRAGRFLVRLTGEEELEVRGSMSPPFGTYRGNDAGPAPGMNRHVLVFLPERRIVAVVRTRGQARTLAAELARAWVKSGGAEPADASGPILSRYK